MANQQAAPSDFYLACKKGDLDLVKRYMRSMTLAEVNQIEPANGSTALHAASYYGHTSVVRHLIECGADRQIRNRYGNIPAKEATNEDIRDIFRRYGNS